MKRNFVYARWKLVGLNRVNTFYFKTQQGFLILFRPMVALRDQFDKCHSMLIFFKKKKNQCWCAIPCGLARCKVQFKYFELHCAHSKVSLYLTIAMTIIWSWFSIIVFTSVLLLKIKAPVSINRGTCTCIGITHTYNYQSLPLHKLYINIISERQILQHLNLQIWYLIIS